MLRDSLAYIFLHDLLSQSTVDRGVVAVLLWWLFGMTFVWPRAAVWPARWACIVVSLPPGCMSVCLYLTPASSVCSRIPPRTSCINTSRVQRFLISVCTSASICMTLLPGWRYVFVCGCSNIQVRDWRGWNDGTRCHDSRRGQVRVQGYRGNCRQYWDCPNRRTSCQ